MKQLASLLSVWSLCCCFQENLVESLIPKCALGQMTVQWLNGTFKECVNCAECHPEHGLYPHKCGDTVTFPPQIECKKCDSGKTFSGTYDSSSCKLCHSCAEHEVVTKKCTLTSDTKCSRTCNSDYFFSNPQQVCKKCSYCCLDGKDEEQPQCINKGLKAANQYCSPRPDRTCTPTQTPTESRSHGKIEWILLCVGIGLLFRVILYCLWRKYMKKRRRDAQNVSTVENGCNVTVGHGSSEDNQGGFIQQEASTSQEVQQNERLIIASAGGFEESLPPVNVLPKNSTRQTDRAEEKKGDESARVAIPAENKDGEDDVFDNIDGEGDESARVAMPAENKDVEVDVFDNIDGEGDEIARVAMPAENKDGEDDVSADNIDAEGAQGGHERRGSFRGLQSFRRRVSNPSNNYVPLSGEDPDQPIEVSAVVPQRRRSRSNSLLFMSALRKSSTNAVLKEENTDQPLGQSSKDVTIQLITNGPKIPQAGSRVEIQCTVRGCVYRWYKDEQELQEEYNPSLILDPLKVQDFGFYRCEVRNDKRYDSSCVESDPDVVELDVTPAEGKSYRKLSEVFERDVNLKETVAKLLEKETTACRKAYKHVAVHFNMKDVDYLERRNNPGEDVLVYLETTHPNLTVYHFCKALKDKNIRRLDIVNKLVGYLIQIDCHDTKA